MEHNLFLQELKQEKLLNIRKHVYVDATSSIINGVTWNIKKTNFYVEAYYK